MKRRAKLFLDRMEGDLAVMLFEGREFYLPRSLMPEGATEGVWLDLTLEIDRQTTAEINRDIARLKRELSGNEIDGDCGS